MIKAVTKIWLPLVATLALGFGVPSAIAANVNVGTGATTNATTSGQVNSNGVSTGASASAGVGSTLTTKSTFSDVMATLSTPDAGSSVDLSKIKRKNIRLIRLSKLKGYSPTAMKLNDSDKQNMASLDATVGTNATLNAVLKKSGYRASDVAAVSTDAKGHVLVFIAR